MSMYDEIAHFGACPVCGETAHEWQSQDGPCELLRLWPRDVKCFYALCEECDTWMSFSRPEGSEGWELHVTIHPKGQDIISFRGLSGKS